MGIIAGSNPRRHPRPAPIALNRLPGASTTSHPSFDAPARSHPTPNPPTMPQDMPPRGGYEPVQFKRNLPAKGFRPGVLLLGMGAVMTYGWYRLTVGMRELNELRREKVWSRIYLTPLLQAEEDRDQVRRYWADQAREKELLVRTARFTAQTGSSGRRTQWH